MFSPNTNEESQKEFKKSESFIVGKLNTESPMKPVSGVEFEETFDITPPLSSLMVPQDMYPAQITPRLKKIHNNAKTVE